MLRGSWQTCPCWVLQTKCRGFLGRVCVRLGLRVINENHSPARGFCPAQAPSPPQRNFKIDETRQLRHPWALPQMNLRGELPWCHIYEWDPEETARPRRVWRDPHSQCRPQLCTQYGNSVTRSYITRCLGEYCYFSVVYTDWPDFFIL